MARKPKTQPSNNAGADAEDAAPIMTSPPAVKRRGRKPKAGPTPVAMHGSDDATQPTFDAEGGTADVSERPARKRPGPKPKQPTGAIGAAPLQTEAKPKRGRKARVLGAASETTSAAEDASIAEVAGQPEEASRAEAVPLGEPNGAVDAAIPAQSAAQWDQATGTAQFDWPAIERTASQEGPNQAMAKLLIAARAEGANSRWPF